jgi:hypothetical protein
VRRAAWHTLEAEIGRIDQPWGVCPHTPRVNGDLSDTAEGIMWGSSGHGFIAPHIASARASWLCVGRVLLLIVPNVAV